MLSGEADANDSYLEVHAGSGGTESQDWASMLLRMYTRWAEKHGYKIDWLEETEGEGAGADDPARNAGTAGIHLAEPNLRSRMAKPRCLGEQRRGLPLVARDAVALGQVVEDGLGGRVGESFPLEGDRMTVGRRPDSDVFLDDVTVSRDHALVVKRGGDFYLDDLGSLNGTYVNRRRIESHRLSDGDELQIGKYKLTFLQR